MTYYLYEQIYVLQCNLCLPRLQQKVSDNEKKII